MKMLTIRQPWAELIVRGIKTIENRGRDTKYRGPVLIHAAKKVDYEYDLLSKVKVVPSDPAVGGVIGICQLVDVVQESDDRFFNGPFGWVLRKPKRLHFIPCTGQLGLINAPASVLRRLAL